MITEAEIIAFVKLAIPPDRRTVADDAVARTAMKKAIAKISKMDGVAWNLIDVRFVLAAGKKDNVQGIDFLSKYPDIKNMQLLYHTDTTGGEIEVVSAERFNNVAAGVTITGRPEIATFNGQGKLSVCPTPDIAYTITARIKRPIDNLNDIPSDLHDLIIDEAVLAIQALLVSGVAIRNAEQGQNAATAESPTGYTGNQIKTDESLGRILNDRNPTSWNLTGN